MAVARDVKLEKPEASLKPLIIKILPAAGGSFIEWYEFAVYGYLSANITGNFFADGRGGNIATWAGFALTFFFRPLGGAFFGWLADRFGRKPAMQLTIGLMLISTVGQGALPSFQGWWGSECCGEGFGWFGLVTLLIFRACQGLSAGGELSTAAVYISEISPPERLGFSLSFISVSGAFGAWAVAAALIAFLQSVLTPEEMMTWGWRVPFLISIIPGALLIFFRRTLEETDDFEAMLQTVIDAKQQKTAQVSPELESGHGQTEDVSGSDKQQASPLRSVFSEFPLAVLVGAMGTAGIGAFWYVPPFYGPQIVEDYAGLPPNAVTFSEMVCYIIPTLLSPFVGMLIDLVGAGRVHALSLVACVLAPAPLFYWYSHVSSDHALAAVYIGEITLGFVQALTSAVYLWTVELFPVHVRATGVSIAYNLGIGIFGGLGPVLSDLGSKFISSRGIVSAPALYTVVCGVLSLVTVLVSRAMGNRGLLRLTHIRSSPY